MEMAGSVSLAALREQLTSLETERELWTQQRNLLAERCAWIERRQQQQARFDALAIVDAAAPTAIAIKSTQNGTPSLDEAERVKASKREEIQELREKTLQLLKTQQQVASKITSRLRTMRATEASPPATVPSSGSSTVPSRSPSPPQEANTVANIAHGHTARRSNKLVLVPTTTTALGKRQLVPGATASPNVSYPPLTRATQVPIESVDELASVAFRVATRHYLQTGTTMTRSELRASVEANIGQRLREDQLCAIMEDARSAIQVVVRDPESQSGDPQRRTAEEIVALTGQNVAAWLDAEKTATAELVTAWADFSPSASRSKQLIGAVHAYKFTHAIQQQPANVALTVDSLLSAFVGRGRRTDHATAEVETAFLHLTSFFQDANEWLHRAATAKDAPALPTAADVPLSGLKFDRPFDIEEDSVLKQIQTSRKRQRRADPMKVLCMYELSGACNDANCPFQHQRDFELVDDSAEATRNDQHNADNADMDKPLSQPTLHLPDSAKAWMHQFVQLRESLQGRWPSVNEIFTSSGRVLPQAEKAAQEETHSRITTETSLADPPPGEDAAIEWDTDFIELGGPLSPAGENEPLASGGNRYCRDVITDESSFRFSVSSLETHLKAFPEDIDAWLMLALQSLELEIAWSDENVVRVSESERLLAQVETLYQLLQPTGPSTRIPTSEAKIEQSLHVLSRALEIEPNAYCEELWLLHLRLSQLLITKRDPDGELAMTDLALRFVPTSVSLWRHFLTLQSSSLDKLDDAVTTYRGLLTAIATASKQAKRQSVKEAFSVLLCDLVIQLCALYCSAGTAADASTFLSSLLDGPRDVEDEDHDQDQAMRNLMIGDDILILYLLHVHLSLFETVPQWLCARAFGVSETVDVYRLLLSSETLKTQAKNLDCRSALRICETAFKTISESEFVPPGVEVLRHNWIVVVAYSDHLPLPARLHQLTAFAEEELQRSTLLPRVVSVLTTLFRQSYPKPTMAATLLEQLMAQYKTTDSTLPVHHVYQRFGEALHHYLLHHRNRLVDEPLRTDFPTLKFLITRLATILPVKTPVCSKRTINAILSDGNWTTQRASLQTMLTELIRATIGHIVDESGHDDADEQDITQDTYYLVAQLQVLSQVCGVQSAIDAVDTIVIQGGSASWLVLPRACRRIVWSVRFMLLVELLKQDPERSRSRELSVLLDRYLKDVGPRSDTMRGIRQQLASRLAAKEDADDMPPLGSAIALCVEDTDGDVTSTLDMELFRLCLAATPAHERPGLFGVYQYHLGMEPAFWQSCAGTALQDSDWRRVRSGLRRLVLDTARVLDPTYLRFLVSLELQDRNVQAAAHALGHRLRVNPLDSMAWELVSVLEVLFGSSSSARMTELVTKLHETGGVRLHTQPLLGDSNPVSLPHASTRTHLHWAGLRLDHIPPTLTMRFSDSLRVLDLRNNLLVALPPALGRLTKLYVLKLSGNALVKLPPSIGLLTKLHVLELAHNHLTEIPNALWDRLEKLRELDVRSNALAGISPRVINLTKLRTLRVAGNHVVWKDLEPISAKLPTDCVVDIAPIKSQRFNAPENQELVSANTNVTVDETTEASSVGANNQSPTEMSPPEADADVEMSVEESVLPGEDVAAQCGPTSVSDSSLPARSPETLDTNSSASSRPDPEMVLVTDNVITVDDDDEAKSDASPTRESKSVDSEETTTVIDVDMTDTGEADSRKNSEAPKRPGSSVQEGESSDDDEVECLGSSSFAAAGASISNGTPTAEVLPSPIAILQQSTDSTLATPSQSETVVTPSEALRRRITEEIHWNTFYPRCSVCVAPNDLGTHQRFNVTILCVACLTIAVDELRKHHTKP